MTLLIRIVSSRRHQRPSKRNSFSNWLVIVGLNVCFLTDIVATIIRVAECAFVAIATAATASAPGRTRATASCICFTPRKCTDPGFGPPQQLGTQVDTAKQIISRSNAQSPMYVRFLSVNNDLMLVCTRKWSFSSAVCHSSCPTLTMRVLSAEAKIDTVSRRLEEDGTNCKENASRLEAITRKLDELSASSPRCSQFDSWYEPQYQR